MLEKMKPALRLDRTTTTPLDPRVAEAMRPWLDASRSIPAAPGARGRAAREALEAARASVARLLGAGSEEILFTSSATEANNLALKGLASASPRPGRILAAATEHISVLHPLRTLERQGHRVILLPVDPQGRLDPETLRRELAAGALLVSVAHASGEIGTVQDIPLLARLAREAHVPFHCDATLGLGSLPFPAPPWGPELVTLTAHLLGGPPGAAALCVRPGLRLRPLLEGGLQEGGLRAGTEAMALIAGWGVAAELARTEAPAGTPAARAAASGCRQRLEELLPDARLTGAPDHRLPGHVSLCIQGVEAEAMLQGLEEEGIEAASGSACTTEAGKPSHVLLAIGVDPLEARGALTLAFGPDHTPADGRRAAETLARVVQRLRSLSPFA
ncbi:MAG TPA: cysteine desulfurase family protein [Candidatus Polarisedimenticolia bacterium]|jgi:cysteine desulfurase|nr:cysteine desulfurase family protein [Candidatus Polarisedimenticolia bacterium]